jgi:hypothetical protein
MKEIKSEKIKRRKENVKLVMQIITPGKVVKHIWTHQPCQGLRDPDCMKAKTFKQQSPRLAKHGPIVHDMVNQKLETSAPRKDSQNG